MNVSRNRHRLIAARRYSRRYQFLPHTSILPIWSTTTSGHDSVPALRAAARLAARKWRAVCREAATMPDEYNCGGWSWAGPPCGGCDRCVREQVLYYGSQHSDDHRAALARLEARTNPAARWHVADLEF